VRTYVAVGYALQRKENDFPASWFSSYQHTYVCVCVCVCVYIFIFFIYNIKLSHLVYWYWYGLYLSQRLHQVSRFIQWKNTRNKCINCAFFLLNKHVQLESQTFKLIAYGLWRNAGIRHFHLLRSISLRTISAALLHYGW